MNAFKTIFARLNMEKTQDALQSIGVAVYDVSGELRSASDIYSDVASKWDMLSRSQKTYLAEALAGKFHITRMMALFDNFKISQDAMVTSQQSLNSSTEENVKHMQSLEAQINKMKASAETLAYSLGENGVKGAMSSSVGVLNTYINGVDGIVNSIGILGTSLSVVAIGGFTKLISTVIATRNEMLAFQMALMTTSSLSSATKVNLLASAGAMATLSNGFKTATSGALLLGRALLFNPITWVVSAVAGLTYFIGKQKETQAEQKRINDIISESNVKYDELNSKLTEMNKLGAEGNISNISKQEIDDIQARINNYDKLIEKIKEYQASKTIVTDSGIKIDYTDVKDLPEQYKELAYQQGVNIDKYTETKNVIDELNKKKEDHINLINKAKESSIEYNIEQDRANQTALSNTQATLDMIDEYKNLSSVQEQSAEQTKRQNELEVILGVTKERGIGIIEKEATAAYNAANSIASSSKANIQAQYNMTRTALEEALKRMNAYAKEAEAFEKLMSQGGTLNKAQADEYSVFNYYKGQVNSLSSEIEKLSQQIYSVPNVSLGGSDKKSSSGSSLSKENKTDDLYWNSVKNSLEQYDNALQKIIKDREKLAEGTEQYRQSLIDENNIHKQKIDYLKKEIETQKQLVGTQKLNVTPTSSSPGKGQAIIDIAENSLGTPYKWGGNDLKIGVDCSGLVQQAYKQVSVNVPRVAQDQYNAANVKITNKKDLQKGDLVFFGKGTGNITHVGIYAGDGQMIEAPHTGAKVRYSSIEGRNFVAGGRYSAVGGVGASTDLNEAQKRLLDLEKELLDEESKMYENINAVRQSYLSQFDKSIQKVNDSLSLSQSTMSLYEESSNSYNKELANQIALNQSLVSELQKKQRYIEQEIQGVDATSKAYEELSSELQNVKKAQIDARVSLINLFKDAMNNELEELDKRYEKNVDRINDKIEETEKKYDSLIKKQQEKLDLLEKEWDAQDRINTLKEKEQEIADTKADTRFEYINNDGNVELTYDKGKVAELEEERTDLLEQYEREDIKNAIQDEIDRLEEAKDRKVEAYKEELEELERKNKREQEDIKDNWNQLITLSQEGQVGFDELMKTWHELTITNQETFHADSLTKIKSYVDSAIAEYKRLANAKTTVSSGGGSSDDDDWDDNGVPDYLPVIGTSNSSSSKSKSSVSSSYSNVSSSISNAIKKITKKHSGGIVGEETPSKITQIANKLFNAKPNEEVILALKRELFVPEQNISNNFIPNMKNLVASITPSNNAVQTLQDIKNYSFNNVTIKANNMSEFLKSINFYITSNQS